MRNFGIDETIDPSRESIGNRKGFFPYMAVRRRFFFLPNAHFQCCMLLQGTLGDNFDIFAASGESTAWVLLWKARSRPVGVRVCPAAQFNFFSTAFHLREWTMVVLWKEDSGRQPQLMIPDNGGGDETNCPSLGPCVPRGPPGPPGPPGLSPGWPPAPSPSGDRERVRTGNKPRERLHPRSPQLEYHIIPMIPENEGGDETYCPSAPRFTSSDDPDVPFRPRLRGPF